MRNTFLVILSLLAAGGLFYAITKELPKKEKKIRKKKVKEVNNNTENTTK